MARTSVEGVLAANAPRILEASVHAVAALVLHIAGEHRLTPDEKRLYVKQLKELLTVARATEASDVP